MISSRSEGLSWTVKVQRLLQLARELVKSRYESGLRVKEVLLPGELGKNKLSYNGSTVEYL